MAKANGNSTPTGKLAKELINLSLHVEDARHTLVCARSVLQVLRDERYGQTNAGIAAAVDKLVDDAVRFVERTDTAIRRLARD